MGKLSVEIGRTCRVWVLHVVSPVMRATCEHQCGRCGRAPADTGPPRRTGGLVPWPAGAAGRAALGRPRRSQRAPGKRRRRAAGTCAGQPRRERGEPLCSYDEAGLSLMWLLAAGKRPAGSTSRMMRPSDRQEGLRRESEEHKQKVWQGRGGRSMPEWPAKGGAKGRQW